MDVFFQWLAAIPFIGGGFSEVAIAEGLAEALMVHIMFIYICSCSFGDGVLLVLHFYAEYSAMVFSTM